MTADAAPLVEKFFADYRLVHFGPGDILVQADAEPSGIFYLVSGQVRQYDIAPTGDQVVVNVFRPPAFFPMSWAINHTPNSYIFEAFTEVDARKAPARDVVAFLRRESVVAFDLLARVYRGTDGLQQRMVYMMEHDARRRVLLELLISAERFGEAQTGGGVYVRMHQPELAARTGLARETTNRALRELRERELLTADGNGMLLPDVGAIRDLLRLQ